MLFSNWASDSAAQDYTIVNVVLLPLWTIVDGTATGLRVPWIFFVMSLFTSLAFSMAMYLAFVERQVRYNRRLDGLQDGVAAVVAGDEGDARAAVAAGTAQVETVDGHGVVGPAPRTRAEGAHELGLQQPVGEVTAGAPEHQLVGVGRVVELAFDEVGEVRGHRGDLGHDAPGHLVAQARLLRVGGADREVEGEAAGGVLPGGARLGSSSVGICRLNDGDAGTTPRTQPS